MKDQYKEALDYYQQALSLDEELGTKKGIAAASGSRFDVPGSVNRPLQPARGGVGIAPNIDF